MKPSSNHAVLRLTVAAAITSALMALISDLSFALVIAAAFVLYAVYLVRAELTHPIVWLLPFIYIYHFNVLVLHVAGLRWSSQAEAILWIGWIAIATSALLFAGFCRTERNLVGAMNWDIPFSSAAIAVGFWACWALAMAQCIMFIRSGVADKVETQTYGTGVSGLNFAAVWMLVIYGLWCLKKSSKGSRFPWRLAVLTGGTALLVTLVVGERDVVLRFALITMLLVYLRGRLSSWFALSAGTVVVCLIPILGSLRNVFTREATVAQNLPFAQMMLFDEFISTGRNIEILLDHQLWWERFYGGTVLWDIKRTLIPGVLTSSITPSNWFNNTFLPHVVAAGQGYGFALSGEGFMNFGFTGVAIFYALMALGVAFLYNRRSRSGIAMTVFLSIIPFVIYTSRSDLSSITSPILKSVLVPILIIYVLDKSFRSLRADSTHQTHGFST